MPPPNSSLCDFYGSWRKKQNGYFFPLSWTCCFNSVACVATSSMWEQLPLSCVYKWAPLLIICYWFPQLFQKSALQLIRSLCVWQVILQQGFSFIHNFSSLQVKCSVLWLMVILILNISNVRCLYKYCCRGAGTCTGCTREVWVEETSLRP